MAEIQARGPIVATFYIYSDIYNYKSGIYTVTAGSYRGSHAVKVVGWGNSNGVNYWIV